MSSERGVKSTSCSIMRSRASNSARIDVRSSSSAAAESSLASCALSGFCKQAGGGKVRKRIATIQTHLAYLRLDHPVVQGGVGVRNGMVNCRIERQQRTVPSEPHSTTSTSPATPSPSRATNPELLGKEGGEYGGKFARDPRIRGDAKLHSPLICEATWVCEQG